MLQGLVRRDLTWPPATYRRPRRKNNSQSQSDGNNLPKLITASNGGGSKIHYVPSVLPTFPASSDLARERGSLPPGAQYVDKKVVLKRSIWHKPMPARARDARESATIVDVQDDRPSPDLANPVATLLRQQLRRLSVSRAHVKPVSL